jgi:hypothetical protein
MDVRMSDVRSNFLPEGENCRRVFDESFPIQNHESFLSVHKLNVHKQWSRRGDGRVMMCDGGVVLSRDTKKKDQILCLTSTLAL